MADTAINFPTPPGVTDATPGQSTPLRYATPEQIRNMYLMAQQLRRHEGGIKNPQGLAGGLGYGLERIGENVGAALSENRANEMANQLRANMARGDQDDPVAAAPSGGAASPRADAGPLAAQTADAGPALSGDTMAALEGHIARNESGGVNPKTGAFNYAAKGPTITNPNSSYYGDRAYGYSQVMGKNVPEWTKQVLGTAMTPEQYLASPDAQQRVTRNKLAEYLQKTGSPRDAASMWFTGRPYSGQTALLSDYQPGARGGMTNQQYSGGLPTTALGFSGQPELPPQAQSAVSALAAGTSQANQPAAPVPQGGLPSPQQQYAQALNPQPQGPQQSQVDMYQRKYFNMIRHGYTPEQAESYVQHQISLLPKYEKNEYGQVVRTQPGAMPQIVPRAQVGPGLITPMAGVPGAFTQTRIRPDNQPDSRIIISGSASQGAPQGAPSGAPGAATTTPTPPIAPAAGGVQFPGIPHTAEEAMTYGARAEAAKEALKENAKTQAEGYGKKFENIGKMAETAQAQLPQLEILSSLIKNNPSFYSGILNEEASTMSQLGKLTGWGQGEMATAIQLAKKLGSAGALEDIRQLSAQGTGAVRVPEMHMIEKSNYDPANTPEANAAVVDIRRRALQRTIDVANEAQKYADSHNGAIDSSFDQQMRDYYKKHPLFSDDEVKHYSDLFSKGAEAAPTTKSIGGKSYVKRGNKWYEQP